MSQPPPPTQADITTLTTQQLSSLQSRFSSDLEHLTTSYQRLRAAQAKFRQCIANIQSGVTSQPTGSPLLVPLTTSLYVPGTLADNTRVIVDVGTGFYVEKKTQEARKFYEGKVEELGGNLAEIERVVGGKSENLRVVEEVLSRKVLEEQEKQRQQQLDRGEEDG